MKKYNYVGWCMAGSLGLSAISGQAAQPEKKEPHIIDQIKCIKCGTCMENCVFDAISIS